jgi:hypothetical protein
MNLGTLLSLLTFTAVAAEPSLTLSREKNYLIIHAPHVPGGEIRINYLEAYCRPGSTDADWSKTVIPHKNELVSLAADGRTMKLRDVLADGVTFEHTITVGAANDEVDFRLVAHNPTDRASEAHWAQPCVRLGGFTGFTGTRTIWGNVSFSSMGSSNACPPANGPRLRATLPARLGRRNMCRAPT